MDLQDVSEEIRTALATITGLRVPPWGVQEIQSPAAIVCLPDRINFDETYGRGKDGYEDLAVVLLIGDPDSRTSIKRAGEYADTTGAKSIKAKLEGYAWTTCDYVSVVWAEFDATATYAGTPYLGVIFHTNIIGKGV